MAPTAVPPLVHRALFAVAVFTFASWVLIAAALLTWMPGRGAAAGVLSRVARAASAAHAAAPLAAVAVSDFMLPCVTASAFAYDDGSDSPDFAWCLSDGDGDVWINDGAAGRHVRGRAGEPFFWFRDHADEFMVRDPALVAQVRDATRPLRELGKEMGAVGAEMGRHGARMGRIGGRMGAVGARLALIEARLASGDVPDAERAEVEASLRDLRSEMNTLRAQLEQSQFAHDDQQRERSHRMSELSARHREMLREVRAQVRDIAARARREGKAERPHANA